MGGVAMGVLSALPIISAGNLCCCLWVVSGGVLAAYLFQQDRTAPITPADGALVGLLAGLVGALVQSLVSIPVDLVIGPFEQTIRQRVLEMGSLPPEVRDLLERYGRSGVTGGTMGAAIYIISRLIGLMAGLFIGGMFSTLGGLLGALIFKKQTPPDVADVPAT
jgi:hypothetical protein